ncbi:hypothetical protein [Amycolatopsis sp. CB00013]|uniref:hypothetical protein n=1 Tax=Amycolatopsis sp. CB00013 TaxID=1703945 RepID=UPI00093E1048|nr:hypothetical protein [Amycolatopsis sp. CB00013]
MEVRIVGALIRLYGLPVSRIVELTIDRFHRDHESACLTLGKNPVLLPPTLAALVERQITDPPMTSRGFSFRADDPVNPEEPEVSMD